MADPEILLSICVPTFNRQFLLERNVTFHLTEFRRMGIPFELVLVDDCSTDETQAYLASLASEPEVSAYRRASNSGFVSNYAFAMRRARGRYAVFLGDDDLLIPEKVVEYVAMMEADPKLGMIQAPWMLVDARAEGAGEMGPFYRLSEPARFAHGDFGGLLRFIFQHHVFPEFLIIRRDVLALSISSGTPFIFWAYLYTARALDKADVLFLPEPFARVTAMSDDPRLQQGNRECMFQWDTYRGGLELIASQVWRMGGPPSDEERAQLMDRISAFMHIRQSVALRLLLGSQHWVEAYVLYHRISAYRPVQIEGVNLEFIQNVAGITMAATEAGAYSDQLAIVDPAIPDDLLEMLPAPALERLTRSLPAPNDPAPRAWLRMHPEFGEPMKRTDAAFSVFDYIAHFI
jgi:hypothetical protein